MKQNLLILVSLITLIGCGESHYKQIIIGNWSVQHWYEESSGSVIAQKMAFVFNEDDTYSIDYGSQVESGKYWFVDDDLLTQETGFPPISVKIKYLQNDSMELQMNRSGSLERIILQKQ